MCVLYVQLVNFFANDCQRVFELMYLLPLCLGGPLLVIASTIYCVNYIGLWALIGALVVMLFYPYQVSVRLSVHPSLFLVIQYDTINAESGSYATPNKILTKEELKINC